VDPRFQDFLKGELSQIREQGLWKEEWPILGPQGPEIRVEGRDQPVLNFCANNYLGLSSHPELLSAAHRTLDEWGYGLSSVRFICGTQGLHRALERKVAAFLGQDDAILYAACFDANGGVFEPLLGAEDAIVTDKLNHASIIDGVRLCKAQRHRYRHADMDDLRTQLVAAKSARTRLIATDGVFSMDGHIAKLKDICDLAAKYDAVVMVDDSHATGFIGRTGRGTPEFNGVMDRVDIITSTLGKAMGGASGGFTTGRAEIVEMLRQRSRPYLFSNSLAPAIVAASIAVLGLLEGSTELRDRLEENTKYFRAGMTAAGFDLIPGTHPICPIMLGDAKLAQDFARDMLAEGIYVIGFSYPVVPKGKARIRVQISAAHTRQHLDRALEAFQKVGKKLGVAA
jgi:glycine C-acetyltransferase